MNIGGNVNGNLAVASTGLSLYDAHKSTMSSLATTTSIDNVKSTMSYTTVNELSFVYVKRQSESDNKYIMAYSGNKFKSSITCTTTGTIIVDGRYYPKNASSDVIVDSYSPNYSGRSAAACKNFDLYTSGSNVNCDYITYSSNVEFLNRTITLKVAHPYYIFT